MPAVVFVLFIKEMMKNGFSSGPVCSKLNVVNVTDTIERDDIIELRMYYKRVL